MDAYEIVRKKSYYEVLKNGFRIATCDFPNEAEAEIESDKQETLFRAKVLAKMEQEQLELTSRYCKTDCDSLNEFIINSREVKL